MDSGPPAQLTEREVELQALLRSGPVEPRRTYVYYFRKGGRYKIGYTANLATRMEVLQPDELLAIEVGGYTLEADRQRQFEHLRIRGERTKDWFHEGPDLLAHIATVAAAPLPPQTSIRLERADLSDFSVEELGGYARKLDAIEAAEHAEVVEALVELRKMGLSWRRIEAETGIGQVSARRYVADGGAQ